MINLVFLGIFIVSCAIIRDMLKKAGYNLTIINILYLFFYSGFAWISVASIQNGIYFLYISRIDAPASVVLVLSMSAILEETTKIASLLFLAKIKSVYWGNLIAASIFIYVFFALIEFLNKSLVMETVLSVQYVTLLLGAFSAIFIHLSCWSILALTKNFGVTLSLFSAIVMHLLLNYSTMLELIFSSGALIWAYNVRSLVVILIGVFLISKAIKQVSVER